METCVCFVLTWCFLVNRNKKLVVLTADKVNSVVQGQQAGCSSLLKGVLHKMLASVFSVQSLPFLFSGRSCWLALMSLIAFDRAVVAVFSCQDGFLHVLYKPKTEQPSWRCSEFLRSVCVTGGEARGRTQPKPGLPAGNAMFGGNVERCRRKGGGEVKRKQVSGLEVRIERSRKTHSWSWWPDSTSIRCRFIFPVFQSGLEKIWTVFNIALFFLHLKQFPLMG